MVRFQNPIIIELDFLKRVKRKYRHWLFEFQNRRLKLQGFQYAIAIHTNAVCYRVHKVGCYNLLKKKNAVRPLYFRTYEDIEQARGTLLEDKDWLECQHCANTDRNI